MLGQQVQQLSRPPAPRDVWHAPCPLVAHPAHMLLLRRCRVHLASVWCPGALGPRLRRDSSQTPSGASVRQAQPRPSPPATPPELASALLGK